MSTIREAVPTVLLSLPLFLASTVFFDVVHWRLHRMLVSRFALLRALAWPHSVHHEWLDRHLEVHRDKQSANVWCHLVLEYLSHLTFSALLLPLLPGRLLGGLVAMQTLVFVLLLRRRGLDLNHLPRPIVEVDPPMFFCLPSYHALHHVYPDAYFSSYVKVVDMILGSALDLRDRRVALAAAGDATGRKLRNLLHANGLRDVVELAQGQSTARDDIDILVLCAPVEYLAALVEPYLEAIGSRQLPPEVWAILDKPDDPVARHYYRDRRVRFRPILLPASARGDERACARAVQTAFRFMRCGARFPPAGLSRQAWRDRLRFRGTRPQCPRGVAVVRRRAAWCLDADLPTDARSATGRSPIATTPGSGGRSSRGATVRRTTGRREPACFGLSNPAARPGPEPPSAC